MNPVFILEALKELSLEKKTNQRNLNRINKKEKEIIRWIEEEYNPDIEKENP